MKGWVYWWSEDDTRVVRAVLNEKKGFLQLDKQRFMLKDHPSLAPIVEQLKLRRKPDIYRAKNGEFSLLELVLPTDDPNDLLSDDLERAFEQHVTGVHELTQSKWDRLVKVGIIFLTIIFSIGGFLLFMVMLNKGGTDFAASLHGVVQQAGLNVTKLVGGG